MAVEPIYRPQVDGGATAGVPRASADAFGAGIGAELVQTGEAIHRNEIRAYQIERQQRADSEVADFNARFAKAREAMDKASIDARNGAAPGGAGHTAAMRDTWEKTRAGLLEGITEDRVRRQAETQLVEFGSRLESSEYEFEQGARVGKLVTDQKDASDASANRASRMHDPKAFAEELSLGRQAIDALGGVPAETKEKLHKYHDETVTVGFLNGLNERDPASAIALLDSGAFDEILDPRQMEQARNGAQIEIRRAAAEADRQAAQEKAEARERINTFQKLLADGVPVPPEQISEMQGLAIKHGLEGEIYDLGKANVVNNVNASSKAWTPIQIDARIKALDAQISAAGDKVPPELVIERNQLASILPTRTSELKNDPLGFAARNGTRFEPVNFSDPASLDRRLSQAKAVTQSTGAPLTIFTDEEAAQLAGEIQTGKPSARLDVANRLARFGPTGALAAVRQVAPGDLVMERAVTLYPKYRPFIFRGAELRKGNEKLAPKQETGDAFQEMAGGAMLRLGPQFANATLETARNIYASKATDAGDVAWNEQLFSEAIHMALGGDWSGGIRRGGVGSWNDRQTMLPTSMNQGEFDRRIARVANFTGMVNPDGTPADAATVKRRFTPVAVRDGVYRWEAPDG
ncbi:hypothetical protein, partial [Sphingomonas sp. LaA6.9]|uniref:hypothetical protein n=1 Tax=Sphingomonas sp. LaA6.9 TaxID=2919914 RepID=UPI001F4F1195